MADLNIEGGGGSLAAEQRLDSLCSCDEVVCDGLVDRPALLRPHFIDERVEGGTRVGHVAAAEVRLRSRHLVGETGSGTDSLDEVAELG